MRQLLCRSLSLYWNECVLSFNTRPIPGEFILTITLLGDRDLDDRDLDDRDLDDRDLDDRDLDLELSPHNERSSM